MAGANEVQKSGTKTEFSLAALELKALRPKTHAAPEDGQPAQPAAPTVELTLNGTQLLLALGAVLSLTAALLWAVLHYWILLTENIGDSSPGVPGTH